MEEWKNVEGYEGCYQISNYGRIKSMKRMVRSRAGFRELPEKIVIPLFASNGYLNVVASKNQKRQTLIIHHLVAKYFIGERPEGLVIDHIDGDKTNNRFDNLRYVTTKENLRKRKDIKLDSEKVKEIQFLIGAMSQSSIAKKFGISQTMVSKIKLGRLWKNV